MHVQELILRLQRYWADEQVVAREIARRSRLVTVDVPVLGRALQRLFPGAEPDRQRLAAATAALRAVTIVAGGPGTGKTTTVAQLLAVLRELHGERLTVALVAPTGKAAARLQEAGCLGVLLSGSGASVFGLARDEAHGREISRRLGAGMWHVVAQTCPVV